MFVVNCNNPTIGKVFHNNPMYFPPLKELKTNGKSLCISIILPPITGKIKCSIIHSAESALATFTELCKKSPANLNLAPWVGPWRTIDTLLFAGGGQVCLKVLGFPSMKSEFLKNRGRYHKMVLGHYRGIS